MSYNTLGFARAFPPFGTQPRGFLDEDRQERRSIRLQERSREGRPVAVDHLVKAAVILDPTLADELAGEV